MFDWLMRDNVSLYSIFMLVLAMLFYFSGAHYIFYRIFEKKRKETTYDPSTYTQSRHLFLAEYDRSNPITQNEATMEYLDFIRNNDPKLAKKISNIFVNLGRPKKKSNRVGTLGDFVKGLDNYANNNMDLSQVG